MVVHGLEGLDEISLSGPTKISELRDNEVKDYTVTPEEFGLQRCRIEELSGGSPEECAAILRAVLQGEKGPRRDVAVLNAGAALYVSGLAGSMVEGMNLAAASIDSGKAREKLEQLVRMTNAA
jgi:anthranilate phosphoribosyltransferase